MQVHRCLPAIPFYISENRSHRVSPLGIDPFSLFASPLFSHRLHKRLAPIPTYRACLSCGTSLPYRALPARFPSIDYEWQLPLTLLHRPSLQLLTLRANTGISRLVILYSLHIFIRHYLREKHLLHTLYPVCSITTCLSSGLLGQPVRR